MGFGPLEIISIGAELIGGLIGSDSTKKQAQAEAEQAAFNAEIAEKQAAFQLEMAEIEAGLTQQETDVAAGQFDANALIADENAVFEARAAVFAERQSAKKWQAQLGSARYAQATSGFRIDDASSDVLAEQVAEMEEDLLALRRTNETRVARAQAEAALLRKQAQSTRDLGQTQIGAIRRGGEIDAETTRLTGQASAQAGRIRATALRQDSFSGLLDTVRRVAPKLSNRETTLAKD
jgi:hypothetical protein